MVVGTVEFQTLPPPLVIVIVASSLVRVCVVVLRLSLPINLHKIIFCSSSFESSF